MPGLRTPPTMNPDDGDPAAAGYSWISRCSSPRLTMVSLQNAFPLVGPALYRTGTSGIFDEEEVVATVLEVVNPCALACFPSK